MTPRPAATNRAYSLWLSLFSPASSPNASACALPLQDARMAWLLIHNQKSRTSLVELNQTAMNLAASRGCERSHGTTSKHPRFQA